MPGIIKITFYYHIGDILSLFANIKFTLLHCMAPHCCKDITERTTIITFFSMRVGH